MNYEEQKKKTTSKPNDFYRTNLTQYDFFNVSEELWLRFNLLITDIDFETLFFNLSTTSKLDKFYEVIVQTVDIIFEKKEAPKENELFKSGNKIPRKVRVLMRNKAKISKAIL